MLYKRNKKAWITMHGSTTWFTQYLKPIVETYWSPKSSDEDIQMYKINAIFIPANTTSFLHRKIKE